MIFLILLGATGFFLFLLCTDLAQNLLITDGSGFIYIAQRMDQGAILYRDIFMTNTPLVPYIYWVYKTVLFGNLQAFYLTGIIEIIAISFVIFFIAKKLHKDEFVSFIIAFMYLTSFTVVSNKLPTGITTTQLMLTLAYLLYLNRKSIPSGILLGLALAAKAYTLPIVLAFWIDGIVSKRTKNIPVLVSGLVVLVVVMVPTIFMAFPQFLEQTFGYSLTRAPGRMQAIALTSFLYYDWHILLLNICALVFYRKNRFLALTSAFLILFFILYQDRHFMYYTMFVPFSVLSFGYGIIFLERWIPRQLLLIMSVSLAILLAFWHIATSIPISYENNRITDTKALLETIQKYNPDYLYGSPYMTQGASYLSGVPVLDNMADTNAALFTAGKYSVEHITKRIFETRTLILIPFRTTPAGIEYPQSILTNSRIPECTVVHRQPLKWSGAQELHVLKCFKD